MTVNLPILNNNSNISTNYTAKIRPANHQISFGDAPKTKVLGTFTTKAFNWLGEKTTPFNRGVIGVVAIATQPWIDLFNKDVDEDTRKASCIRTAAKIVVGTTTGILVRMGCIRLMNEFTKTKEELKGKEPTGFRNWLKPSSISHEEFAKAKSLIKDHRNAIGTFVAIGVMMLTDPPLTLLTTNFLNKHIRKDNKPQNINPKGGK